MGVKRYFKRELQWSMFSLEEENASHFTTCCFQRNRSAVPLLLIRFIVFMGCLGILLASNIMTAKSDSINYGHWYIFLTHWGLLFITATSCLGFAVSVTAYIKGPIDATFGLPWYIKAYWVTYNFTIPIAFFITVFYWSLLTAVDEDFALNKVLDIFIHGINSVLMMLLLLTSRHSSRLLHFHHALLAGIVYLIFSVIYYFAGGLNPFGSVYIYPMLDWSRPGLAIPTCLGSALLILVMHCIVVAIAAARNALTRRCAATSFQRQRGNIVIVEE